MRFRSSERGLGLVKRVGVPREIFELDSSSSCAPGLSWPDRTLSVGTGKFLLCKSAPKPVPDFDSGVRMTLKCGEAPQRLSVVAVRRGPISGEESGGATAWRESSLHVDCRDAARLQKLT
jgi:hypothetical protein